MPHEIHFPILTHLGLNETECVVYELLLERGPKPAQDLLLPSGLKRGNLYNALTTLKKKGLVFEQPGKKTIFSALNPESLRSTAKSKIESAQEVFKQLEAVLPTLKSHYNQITKAPTIRIFEGLEGVKELFIESLKNYHDTELYYISNSEMHDTDFKHWWETTFTKKRIANNIHAIGLTSGDNSIKRVTGKTHTELRTNITIDKNLFPFSGNISVIQNNVAFIYYKPGETLALILESDTIANTIKTLIKYIFSLNQITLN